MHPTPVIVGTGEITDRPDDPALGSEPAALAVEALRRAEADAGAALLGRLDSLDVVRVVSWPYADLPRLIAERLGASPARLNHGPVGGQTPIQFLHEAAARIARGESRVAAVCGAESSHSAARARQRGIALPWTAPPPDGGPAATGWLPPRDRSYLHPLARAAGVTEPVTVYPLYENAVAAAWGQTPAEAQAESAALWSGLAAVAADNPGAWLRTPLSADEVARVSPANRMIAHPYPKRMVANPAVNMGAAILLTDTETARAAGIPERRWVHVGAAAAAAESRDWCARDGFDRAAGQDAVLDAIADAARGLDLVELYSCFPVVPKMARRRLGRPADAPISLAGGLSFHGAPLNNYMTHAAAAAVRALRDAAGPALLYGQGGTLTAHYALLLGNAPDPAVGAPASRQADADQRRGPVPAMVEPTAGPATLETFTIPFDRDGEPETGTAVLRLPDGARTLAAIDPAALSRLRDPARSPIGLGGRIRFEGRPTWSP